MTPDQFINKWKDVQLTERSASQQHFLDLCELLNHPKPAAEDPKGEWFTFEKGAAKAGGGDGWADVWKKGFFGWEYKGKHKDLGAAYLQLLKYKDDLENPPLMVVCDMDRIIIRTNFTGTPTEVHTLSLDSLADPETLRVLRAVFTDPQKLKPGVSRAAITREAAQRFGEVAQSMRGRGLDPRDVARFLDRVVFCMFAEDVGLLPEGLFSRILHSAKKDPAGLRGQMGALFQTMAGGGYFGADAIRWFNGNLFTDGDALELTPAEITAVAGASALDWASVDPSVLGTLFERGLDPDSRTQLGAHYTSREDIETLIEPVALRPLRREWEVVRGKAEALLTADKEKTAGRHVVGKGSALTKKQEAAASLLSQFVDRLGTVTVLDPACGSGNFLFVTLQKLKDLELEAIRFAYGHHLPGILPAVSPAQVYGIERNPYAHALAQMTVWIGFLQWNREHGFGEPDVPVLKAMDNFQCMDAILTEEGGEPEWPSVDYIVGNPPFLGDKLMRGALGDVYVDRLRKHYAGRIPGQSDLCCYWFEKARDAIAKGAAKRAGLLATQAIRQPANRQVFERIKETGDIFFAESDRPWVLDGANVHISMAGFDDGTEQIRTLDRANVAAINSNLTAFADLTRATKIKTNAGIGLIGATKKAPFDLSELSALEMLHEPNVHSRPNSDVLLPYLNAADVTGRWRWKWVIDFGSSLTESEASLFEAPFRYVQREVFPLRKDHREAIQARFWWRFARPVPALKAKTASLERCLVTPSVAKHRVFAWFPLPISPAHRLVVFARDDDFILGVLQSRYHECWALRLGSRLETRPCYTPTTCFETFPFPTPTPAQEAAIGEAARELVRLRDNWLNPLEWTREEVLTFPAALDGPWARFVRDADARGIGTAHYPRLVPKDETAAKALKVRTLTNLYNARPAWLDNAHKKLDAAVAEAYGWPTALGEEEIISRLLVLNLQREGKTAQLRGEIK